MDYEFSENRKTIVIAHPSRKRQYLQIKAKKPYLDMEVMTLEEMKRMFDYQHDDRALVLLLSKGFGYKTSKEILSALVSHHYERGEEVKEFDAIRNELIEKGYLYKTPYPEKTFQDADIIVSGYFSSGSLIKEYLGNVLLKYDDGEEKNQPLKTYCKFTDIYEELHYVYNQIAADLDQGTPIEDIYVYGVDKDYATLLKQFSKYYGFTIDMETPSRLYDTNIYRFFRDEYLANDIESSLASMRDRYCDSKDADTIEKFARAYANVFPDDKNKTVELFDEIAKAEKKYIKSKKNVVKVLDEAVCPKNAHLYFLNFSMGTYPKSPSDEGYFSQEEKERIGLETAKGLSRKDSEIIDHALRSGSLRLITFAEDIFGTTKFECSFKDKYGMTEEKNPKPKTEYALDKGAFLCASLQDSKRNYLQEDARRQAYENITGVSMNYPSFDQTFKGKKKGRNTSRKYSYSSLKSYRECPFKYLLSKILRLDSHENTFNASIGNIFHGVFEEHYKDPTISFDEAYDRSLKKEQGLIANPSGGNKNKITFSNIEKAIIGNLKEYCKIAYDFQLRYEKFLQNPRLFPEKEFNITLDDGAIISGRYDKVTEFEYKGSKYCFIIDYKTNNERFDEKLLRNFGLSLQLPVYALAISHDQKLLGDAKLAGLFISPILNFKLENEKGENITDEDKKGLKLSGVFLNDISLFRDIDPLMEESKQFIDSSFVEGFRLKKNGLEHYKTGEYTRFKTEEELKELGDMAEKYIKQFDKRIMDGDFAIDPLLVKGNCNACEYCLFHDICYVDKRKIKTVSIDGDIATAGEEENDAE